jgi:hypothetical protein
MTYYDFIMAGSLFFLIDITIALSIPFIMVIMRLTGKIGRFSWVLYWLGCGIGALWEIPFYFIGPDFSSAPLYILKTPTPYPLFLLHFVHCFWDGGLFMAGYFLVKKLCRPPHFMRFRMSEMAVQLVWGGLQELAVELLSTGNAGWAFVPRWWNPAMFRYNGMYITLLPQLIWVAAPVIFYFGAIMLNKSFKAFFV